MFLAWQERCSSSRKFQTVSTRIVQEVVRNIQQQTRSQKRLPQIDQEQSRQKTNELTPL